MSGRTKKILSFDVGIINLAYCLLEVDYDTEKFVIHDWDIINTADNRYRCPFVMRGGNMCNKVAQRKTKIDSDNVYYACSAHWNKSLYMMHSVEVNWFESEPQDVEECCMCKSKTKRAGQFTSNVVHGNYCKMHHMTISRQNNYICEHKGCKDFITNGLYLKNIEETDEDTIVTQKLKMGWCNTHYLADYREFIKKKTKKISQNANKIPLELIGGSMYAKLDAKSEFLQVDEVLIENQPSLINPTMKSVAMILYSYFLMNCFHRRDQTQSTVTNLSYCSASNKLKVGGQKVADTLDIAKNTIDQEIDSKKVYDITKDTGKKICSALIAGQPEYQKMYDAHKKQDDLADAFLQGFVMNFKEVPEHYARMLEDANVIHKDEKTKAPKRAKATKATKATKTAKATKATKSPKAKVTKSTNITQPKSVPAKRSVAKRNTTKPSAKTEDVSNVEKTSKIEDVSNVEKTPKTDEQLIEVANASAGSGLNNSSIHIIPIVKNNMDVMKDVKSVETGPSHTHGMYNITFGK
jgi:hypothetical protein